MKKDRLLAKILIMPLIPILLSLAYLYTNSLYVQSASDSFSIEGPNAAVTGQSTSGTVAPVYATLSLTEGSNTYKLVVLAKSTESITPDSFTNGYISLGSGCDTRWINSVSSVEQYRNGIIKASVLDQDDKPRTCYLYKNDTGNVISLEMTTTNAQSFDTILHLFQEKLSGSITPQ